MRRLLLCLLAVSACSRPDHIEIDPRAPLLAHKGEAVRLHAKLLDRTGRDFPTERASWKWPAGSASGAKSPVAAASNRSAPVHSSSSGASGAE